MLEKQLSDTINFVKPLQKTKFHKSFKNWLTISVLLILLSFIIFCLIHFITYAKFIIIKEQSNKYGSADNLINNLIVKKKNLENKLSTLKRKNGTINNNFKQITESLETINSLLPSNTRLETYFFKSDKTILIKGETKTWSSLTCLLNNLINSNQISSSNLVKSDHSDKTKKINFLIRILINK